MLVQTTHIVLSNKACLVVLPVSKVDIGANGSPQASLSAFKRGLAEELGSLLDDLAEESVRL